jgi:hypothetical protein
MMAWRRIFAVAGACAVIAPMATTGGCRGRGKKATEAPAAVAIGTRAASDPGLEMWSWMVSDERRAVRIVEEKERMERAARPPGASSGKPPTPGSTKDAAEKGQAKGGEPAKAKDGSEPKPETTVRVVDRRVSLESLLARYRDRPAAGGAERIACWRAAGFRVVSVPRVELAGIEGAARLVGVVERQWLGTLTLWTELARGAEMREAGLVRVCDGTRLLARGRTRLLARAYAVPRGKEDGTLGMSLRVEMVPQQLAAEADAAAMKRDENRGGIATSELQGELLQTLSLSLDLDGSDAVLIVPDSPEADWGAIASKEASEAEKATDARRKDARDSKSKGSGEVKAAEEPSEGATPAGDGAIAFAAARALGDVMLSSVDESGRRVRRVLVLVPHVSERFRVLGP